MPHFTYCSVVWHFCKASNWRKLERINERGLRTVYNDWSASYDDLLSRAKMTTLYNRRLQDLAIFMFKIKHDMLPSYAVTELYLTLVTQTITSETQTSDRNVSTLQNTANTLRHFGPLLWSKINREIRSAPTLSNFIRGIRKTDIASLIDDSCNSCVLCKS